MMTFPVEFVVHVKGAEMTDNACAIVETIKKNYPGAKIRVEIEVP